MSAPVIYLRPRYAHPDTERRFAYPSDVLDDQIARAPSPIRAYREKNGAGFLILSGVFWALAVYGAVMAAWQIVRGM